MYIYRSWCAEHSNYTVYYKCEKNKDFSLQRVCNSFQQKSIKLSSEDIGWVSYNTYPQGVNSQFSRRTIVPIPWCGFPPYIIKHSSVIRWVSYNSIQFWHCLYKDGLPRALVVKNLPANVRDIKDLGSIPGSGRSLGGRHGNPLQYSCLENPMDREDWCATVHGVSESDMTDAT